jgi:hypothetical protein
MIVTRSLAAPPYATCSYSRAWVHAAHTSNGATKSISSTPSNSPTRTRQGPVRGVAAVGVDPDRRVCRPGVIVHEVEVVGITPSDRQAAPATAG